MLGDFNQVLYRDEKQGGIMEPLRKMEPFRQVINQRKLIDLPAQGCHFTWSNRQDVSTLIRQKLDRAFCSVKWRHAFLDASVRNLPRAHSDHCPVLVKLASDFTVNKVARPFRFEAA